MSAPRAALEVRARLALDRFELDVDFVSERQVTGVFGASGVGKTSLLEVVAGLRRGARGHVAFGDETWLDTDRRAWVAPERRGVGLVPQDGLLFPHFDVLANLTSGRHGAPDSDTRRQAIEVLELGPLLERMPATLSGGERQRVALGRALCSGARLLLLDEPLASLDLPLRRRLLPFLNRVRHEFKTPMLIVSHDPVEMQALCDDLIVLHDGKVIARGTPFDVLTDPHVYPLAEVEGPENVFEAHIVERSEASTRVRIGPSDDGPELVLPRLGVADGRDLLLALAANQILIATEPPRGISARNVLPAEISKVARTEQGELVTARLLENGPSLVVEVTESALLDLDLHPGRRVHVLIKASAVRLFVG